MATKKFGKKSGWHKRVLVNISPDVIEAIDGVLGLHRDRQLLSLVRSPVYDHGVVLVAADASTKDGWGAHVVRGGVQASCGRTP